MADRELTVRIDRERFWSTIERSGQIGPGKAGGLRRHATEGKATVPRLVAWPNKAGILSAYAQLTCDVRHADPAKADAMLAEIHAAMADCARAAPTWRCAWRPPGPSATSASIPGVSGLIKESADRGSGCAGARS